jgi:hypothetical protein
METVSFSMMALLDGEDSNKKKMQINCLDQYISFVDCIYSLQFLTTTHWGNISHPFFEPRTRSGQWLCFATINKGMK